MKIKIIQLFIISLFFVNYSCGNPSGQVFEGGRWKINYSADNQTVSYVFDNKTVLSEVYVQTTVDGVLLKSSEYENVSIKEEVWDDNFGHGTKHTITYSAKDKPSLAQILYLYPDNDYFFTETLVTSKNNISTNHIASIVSEVENKLETNSGNQMLFVPFDNDAWVRYASLPLDTSMISFEATTIYNGDNRSGLVIGSVEHDTWKSGIKITASENIYIDTLECFSGVTHGLTRDILKHGEISGKELKSAKVFVGYFDDWRKGMDTYAEANATITPPRKWEKGTPFGWNSWGSMKEKVNYTGAKDVAKFIKEELQPRGFENNGLTVIDLDSFWDNFSHKELKEFVDYCKSNNQIPGIYWGPFADWGKNPEATVVEGFPYKYKDIYLYANDKPQDLDGAYAIDPTHPGTMARIDRFMKIFHEAGFEYIKLDFVTHGALEADSHYDTDITTGIQAYNAGMQYVTDKAKNMFVALSIAPSFPSQYGHSKRIGCDAWGAINDTEYTMNGLTFGWWLDKVYTYNDADHLVLDGCSDGENRARITSGVITGIYLLGDNFSLEGSHKGTKEARTKALEFACNKEVNNIARIGRSFSPVEGYALNKFDGADSMFVLHTDTCTYLAVFNYTEKISSKEVSLDRIGLSPEVIKAVKELWFNKKVGLSDRSINIEIPAKDARIFKFEKQ